MGRASNKKKSRRNSSLKEQVRRKKKLVSPLLDALSSEGSPQFYHWVPDILPEMVWLAAVHDAVGGNPNRCASLVYPVLDVLEGLQGKTSAELFSGTVSSFGELPEALREQARGRLLALDHYDVSFPPAFRIAMRLYPRCPMEWLFQDDDTRIDPAVGLDYLKTLLLRYWDSVGIPSTQLRMFVIARYAQAGRLLLPPPPSPIAEPFLLLCDYPEGLSDDQRHMCESVTRATFGMLQSSWQLRWSEYFWNQSYKISACECPNDTMPVHSPEQWITLVQSLRVQLEPILRTIQRSLSDMVQRLPLDLYRLDRDEVLLGLLSRMFQLISQFVFRQSMWTEDMSSHLVRALADTLIQLSWLRLKDDSEFYKRYKSYGLGKKKLLKLHLEDLTDAGRLKGQEETIQELEAIVNEAIWEEFQDIDLGGNFSGKDVRSMATEADLKEEYDTVYSPASANVHGDWTSIALFNMNYCRNPLHRFHRLPDFTLAAQEIPIRALQIALSLFRKGLDVILACYPETGTHKDIVDEKLEEASAILEDAHERGTATDHNSVPD